MPTNLDTFARNGILSFSAYVEYREEGQWVQDAKGSSVKWLMDVVREDLEIHRDVRVTDQYGDVLATFTRR